MAHEGHRKRERALYQLATYLAWHIAAFTRVKRLPSLESLLQKFSGETRRMAPMSADEMKSFLKGLTGVKPLTNREKLTLAKRQARAKGKK